LFFSFVFFVCFFRLFFSFVFFVCFSLFIIFFFWFFFMFFNKPTKSRRYFFNAIEADPTNRVALCTFGEFAMYCGQYQLAEEFFLRTLELDPQFAYGLMEYGKFLCRRGFKSVGQMFLEKSGSVSGVTIDAITGKEVSGTVSVTFPDKTKKTVNATPATTTADLMDTLKKTVLQRLGPKAADCDMEVRFYSVKVIVVNIYLSWSTHNFVSFHFMSEHERMSKKWQSVIGQCMEKRNRGFYFKNQATNVNL
jgi:hypothetical protein